VALTEHNTISHATSLRELARYFDDMLLIPAREVTTFRGTLTSMA
jgi:predicted metal-dependent phosphoesterase TrpH